MMSTAATGASSPRWPSRAAEAKCAPVEVHVLSRSTFRPTVPQRRGTAGIVMDVTLHRLAPDSYYGQWLRCLWAMASMFAGNQGSIRGAIAHNETRARRLIHSRTGALIEAALAAGHHRGRQVLAP